MRQGGSSVECRLLDDLNRRLGGENERDDWDNRN